jgi:hypothetical protein
VHPYHQGLKDALNEGIKSLHKWYGRANVDGTSPAYFICLGMFSLSHSLILQLQANFSTLVLDPNVKDLYFRGRWNSEQYSAGMQLLEEVVSHSIGRDQTCAMLLALASGNTSLEFGEQSISGSIINLAPSSSGCQCVKVHIRGSACAVAHVVCRVSRSRLCPCHPCRSSSAW